VTADRPPITARTFALLAAASAAFTVYGSLVPFTFRAKAPADAIAQFRRDALESAAIDSKSDFVANVFLGVPLGFCLLAALRVDRPHPSAGTVAAAAVVWPLTVGFAAAVEFAQLFAPGRVCAGSDVVAQSLGSAVGVGAWLAAGPKLTRWVRGVWTSRRVGGTAGRVLLAYGGLLALTQALPLDLTASPADLYRKVRDGNATLVPFGELAGSADVWGKVQSWTELAGLYAIAGLLAAGVPAVNTLPGWRVLALGLLVAGGMEAIQMPVKSRHPSATDVLVGGVGAFAGYLVGRAVGPGRGVRGISLELGLLLAQAWVLGALLANWQPFQFEGWRAGPRLAATNWVPFAAASERNYLSSLEEALSKTLLYTPLGAVVVGVGPFVYRTRRPLVAAAVGAAVAAAIEGGQLFLPSRTPGPTDLVFGAVGGWLGAAVAHRLRCATPEARALADKKPGAA
jgi:VanZ family protein